MARRGEKMEEERVMGANMGDMRDGGNARKKRGGVRGLDVKFS